MIITNQEWFHCMFSPAHHTFHSLQSPSYLHYVYSYIIYHDYRHAVTTFG